MSWSGQVELIKIFFYIKWSCQTVLKCSIWSAVQHRAAVTFPSLPPLNFLLSPAISPLFSTSLLCTLCPSFIPSLSLSSHSCTSSSLSLSPPQREWVSVWLSGEERWVLPSQILFQRNSSSGKHVCLHRANAGLLLQFHKQRRSARHAEINTNPKTNKHTKGKKKKKEEKTDVKCFAHARFL